MQRYQPSLAWIDNNAFAHADEDADGDFVLYADAKSAIDAAARENSRLRAVVEAARYLRAVELQREKDEVEYAASGATYGVETLVTAEEELDAALSALDAKGGG